MPEGNLLGSEHKLQSTGLNRQRCPQHPQGKFYGRALDIFFPCNATWLSAVGACGIRCGVFSGIAALINSFLEMLVGLRYNVTVLALNL